MTLGEWCKLLLFGGDVKDTRQIVIKPLDHPIRMRGEPLPTPRSEMYAENLGSVAIGYSAVCTSDQSVAIGVNAVATRPHKRG